MPSYCVFNMVILAKDYQRQALVIYGLIDIFRNLNIDRASLEQGK